MYFEKPQKNVKRLYVVSSIASSSSWSWEAASQVFCRWVNRMRGRERPVHGSRYTDVAIGNKHWSWKTDPWRTRFSLGCVFKEIDVTEECIKMRKLVTSNLLSSPQIVWIQDSLSQNGHDFLKYLKNGNPEWGTSPLPWWWVGFPSFTRFPHCFIYMISTYRTPLHTRHRPSLKYCRCRNETFQRPVKPLITSEGRLFTLIPS